MSTDTFRALWLARFAQMLQEDHGFSEDRAAKCAEEMWDEASRLGRRLRDERAT